MNVERQSRDTLYRMESDFDTPSGEVRPLGSGEGANPTAAPTREQQAFAAWKEELNSAILYFMMTVGVITWVVSDDTPADKVAALEFMLPFILLSCWLIRIWWKLFFGDKSRYYAVSSRFLLRYENNTLKAALLHDNIILNLNIGKDGSGNIIIRKPEEKEGLFCLAEADRVAGILQRAAENIPPVPMPPAHRDLTHADEQLPVSVRVRLREVMVPGDRLLWADRPRTWLPAASVADMGENATH